MADFNAFPCDLFGVHVCLSWIFTFIHLHSEECSQVFLKYLMIVGFKVYVSFICC